MSLVCARKKRKKKKKKRKKEKTRQTPVHVFGMRTLLSHEKTGEKEGEFAKKIQWVRNNAFDTRLSL
jgi:hypothetical protein